jgi:hypothetical protein
MAENLTTDNIKYISALDFGLPSASDLGIFWSTASSVLKKYYAGLNRGIVANTAALSALNTDVITSLPHVGDFAVFGSTATNVPDANAYYISCIGGGYSATGARYLAFRTGGYVYFGYIATAGTVTWVPLVLGTTNIASLQTATAVTQLTITYNFATEYYNNAYAYLVGNILFLQFINRTATSYTLAEAAVIASISGLPTTFATNNLRGVVAVDTPTIRYNMSFNVKIVHGSSTADVLVYPNDGIAIGTGISSVIGVYGGGAFYLPSA